MFRGLTVYQITQSIDVVHETLVDMLKKKAHQFKPCGEHTAKSAGFVAPLGEETKDMAYATNGGMLFCLRVDEKAVPPAAVKLQVEAMVREKEKKNEEVTKGDRIEFKESVIEQMLPGAVPEPKWYYAYLDQARSLFYIAADEKNSDAFVEHLKKTMKATPFKVLGLNNVDPCVKFTEWLTDPDKHLGEGFKLGHACSLKHPHEGGTAIYNISHEDLTDGELQSLLNGGKQCCRIALEHEELNFAITAKLRLASLSLADEVKDRIEDELEDNSPGRRRADEFASWVIIVRKVMDELEKLMGGWPVQENLDLKTGTGD